jgi:nicotinamidase-related amidase
MTDETLSDLLALVTSGRPDSLVEIALSAAGEEATTVMREVREAVASLAVAEPPQAPSPELRARIFRSLEDTRRVPRRAVVVMDMQNDHLLEGRTLEVPRARDIVPALWARLEAARHEHTPVVYVVDEHDPDDTDLDAWGAHNIRGTDGARVWAALTPRPGDTVVAKATYSAFTGSRLAQVLGSLGVDTLELTGCLTEVGIFATAADALQRGYAVEVPRETQAGATQPAEEAILSVLGLLHPYGPARMALLASLGSAE